LGWYSPKLKRLPKRLPRRRPLKTIPSGLGDKNIVGNWLFYYLKGGDHLHDFSPYDNHGEIKGAKWVDGSFGWALDFDGVDDYISLSNTGVTSPVTVSAWIYPRTAGENDYGRIFDQFNDFDLALGDGQGYAILWEINDNNYWYGADPLAKDTWHHIVAIIDSDGHGWVYHNGDLLDDQASETVTASNNNAAIAHDLSGARWFDGIITLVRIYKEAKSSSWVSRQFERTRGIFRI